MLRSSDYFCCAEIVEANPRILDHVVEHASDLDAKFEFHKPSRDGHPSMR